MPIFGTAVHAKGDASDRFRSSSVQPGEMRLLDADVEPWRYRPFIEGARAAVFTVAAGEDSMPGGLLMMDVFPFAASPGQVHTLLVDGGQWAMTLAPSWLQRFEHDRGLPSIVDARIGQLLWWLDGSDPRWWLASAAELVRAGATLAIQAIAAACGDSAATGRTGRVVGGGHVQPGQPLNAASVGKLRQI